MESRKRRAAVARRMKATRIGTHSIAHDAMPSTASAIARKRASIDTASADAWPASAIDTDALLIPSKGD